MTASTPSPSASKAQKKTSAPATRKKTSTRRVPAPVTPSSQPPQEPQLTPELKQAVLAALSKKAESIKVLALPIGTAVADAFFICSVHSERQAQAVADAIEDDVRVQCKQRPLRREGYHPGTWILLDYGDWMAHIFLEPVRAQYDLEGRWAEATRVEIPQELYQQGLH